MNNNLTFQSINNERLKFLKKYQNQDHQIIIGENNILISAPHGVSQVRLGKRKFKEIGSLNVALALQNLTGSFLIAKTQNNYDDANFDQICEYKDDIDRLIVDHNIKYILDIHGLAVSRPCDVNLGINFGKNIETDVAAFDMLAKFLKNNNFEVSIDQPFSGGLNTVAGSTKTKHPNVWTIQLEINSSLTIYPENFERLKLLINILVNWITLLG